MALEQEIKIPLADVGTVRNALAQAGCTLVQGRTFEDNVVLDDAGRSLSSTHRLLRLRSFAEKVILTFKGPPSFADGVKSRREVETSVGDFTTALELLAALGLTPLRRYQKWREVWRLEGVAVVLDETPMGAFVELEGEAGRLRGLARRLGLDPDAAVSGSYLELWRSYREDHPESPEDMVFP